MHLFQQKFHQKSTLLKDTEYVDLSLFPPCLDGLHMDTLRANYQSFLWRNYSALLNLLSSKKHGWYISSDSKLSVKRVRGSTLPQDLINVCVCANANEESEEEFNGPDEYYSLADVVFEDLSK